MALYDISEFLTLNDAAEYLADKCNYDFNLECSTDQNRLIETIIQLVRNDKLHPVFHYSGNVDFLEKKVITRKSGRFINHEMVLLDITYNIISTGYYFVNDKNFNKLIENNYSSYINVINCTIEPYHVEGKQEICENNTLYYRKVKENFSIIFHDLLYPKLDLDKIFNQTEADTEVIEKLIGKIEDLQNQLVQAKAELADKPSDSDKDLNTKSQNYVAKIVLAMAQIADLNLDSPYACKEPNTTNSIIFDQIKTNGMRVSNQVIGNWLKLAIEQSKDD